MNFKLLFLSVIGLIIPNLIGIKAQQQSLRPPAYPLITVDPNFSIWSMQDTLYNGPTRHWTKQAHSLKGIIRVDGEPYYFMGRQIPQYRNIVPTGREGYSWKYTFSEPAEGWQQNSFNANSWKITEGPFSNSETTPNKWNTRDIWVRRTFQIENLDNINLESLLLYMYHDDNVEVYLNGVLAYQKTGWVGKYQRFKMRPEARKALKEGQNMLAIHCSNTAGGAYLDAGLVERRMPAEQVSTARQTDVAISATQTRYTFEAGSVELQATFTAPLLPDDLELISRPANYISFDVTSADGRPHDVQIYLSAASNITVNTTDQQVVWQRMPSPSMDIMRVGTADQQILGRKGDNVRIDWGYLYLSAPEEEGLSSRMTANSISIADFVDDGTLTYNDDGMMPRTVSSGPLTLAAAYDFGSVSDKPQRRHVTLAYDDLYGIEYFHQPLQAWWKTDGQSAVEMLHQAETDYDSLMEAATAFDRTLFEKAEQAGGTKYAELTELAYRQAVAAHKLVASPEGQSLFFSKENFSNGSIGTVDVTYPSAPLFLYYSPELLKGMLRPIFYYTESGRWKKPFPAHDVGTYPIANGQTYGEDMPVEEAGNMLIMTTAIAQAEGNAAFAANHWESLTEWANYLMEHGMDPKNQLSTDDFAGHLARNANLSVKAILGIAGYGQLADMLGKADVAQKYSNAAREMASKWHQMADAGDHYMLAFGKPNTWSQKYNLAWDDILDLNVFPDEINKTEIAYYLEQQNEYGLPLDNRALYTKSDWIIWTATLADNQATFEKFIDPMYKAFDTTSDRVPMTDWYWTDSGDRRGFQARSVVGGYFMPMLEEKLKND